MRLDLDAISAMPDPRYALLPESMRESLSRLGRAMTHRRVGVALGGSGAWSYGHVALLRGLLALDIPIDMVSGASGGALVGAYYCAQGLHGLDTYVRRALTLQLLIVPAMFSMSVLQAMINFDLGPVKLEETEVPMFPIATNLTTGRQEIMANTTLGFAVRAASSAPGLFASTIIGKTIYVDGAVANNVPATVVRDLGADLVIASNALPAPIGRPIFYPTVTSIGRFLQQLNPLGRIGDFLTSVSLTFHNTGNYQARAAEAQVLYQPTPQYLPLLRAFNFVAAQRIMKNTVEDVRFAETLRSAKAAWDTMAEPRVPSGAVS